MHQILTVEDLSKVIHKSVSSIYSDLIRNPFSLPPHFKIPGSRRVLWREQDVQAWIDSFVAQPENHEQPKRGRGRPTKAEQRAAQ